MNTIDNGNICSPQGFEAAGVHCGIKSRKSNLDLALLVSATDAQFAGAFTDNQFAAPPVQYCRDIAATRSTVRALVVNSGNANACTGRQGRQDTGMMASKAAECLELDPEQVMVSSTGIIGVPLPMAKIIDGIVHAAAERSAGGGAAAAEAIMTTDNGPKTLAVSIDIGGTTVTVAGMAKGAGMIAPHMVMAEPPHATMLAYITTDAVLDTGVLHSCLEKSLDLSFNRISVDGDRSTNDSFIALANGLAGNAPVRAGSYEEDTFESAFNHVAAELAKMMVRDGEGASKFVEITVTGAPSVNDARTCAEAIGRSQLCKTAWFGSDPNWGRIIAAVGYAGIEIQPESVSLHLDDVPVVRGGIDAGTPEKEFAKVLKKDAFRVCVDLGVGDGEFTFWTCDLTHDYVSINADYRS